MWRQKPKLQKSDLPTNIHDATRDYVRDRLAAWDEKVLAERAATLGIPLDAAREVEPKPLYLVEAEKRAEAEGRSLESVLQEYSERLKRSDYPGPHCFLPDEIMEYAQGALPEERLLHAEKCPGCATLLGASKPVEGAVRGILDALAEEESGRSVEPVLVPALAASGAGRWVPVLKSWLPLALLPGVVLVVAYLYFRGVDSSATKLTFVHSWIPWVVAVAMALVMLAVFGTSHLRPIQRSIGAGMAAGVVAASFLFIDFRQSQNSRDLAVTFAQDRLETVCADSIQNHQKTGEFLKTFQSIEGFQLATSEFSGTKASYVLTGKELPGKVVCNLGSNLGITGGDLKWEYEQTVKERDLFTGTVHQTDAGAVVKVVGGKSYPLKLVPNSELIDPGAFVLAIVDPKTSTVQSVRVIDKAPHAVAALPRSAIPKDDLQ